MSVQCTTCGKQNDELAVVCTECKGYLQTKIDTLHLFETVWGLIESPSATFRTILLSKHKNYVLILSGMFGIGLAFDYFWFATSGDQFDNVFSLSGVGFLIGPPVGIGICVLVALVLQRVGRMWGRQSSFRNQFAVLSFASVPVVLSVILILPLEIAIFGKDVFGSNPPPMLIKPAAYIVFMGLNIGAHIWSLSLLTIGTRVGLGLSRGMAIIVATFVASLLSVAFWGLRTSLAF